MVKSSSWAGGDWVIVDAMRDVYNVMVTGLAANSSTNEAGASLSLGAFDFLSNGFVPRYQYDSTNRAGTTFVWAAFAEAPFQFSRAR